MKTDIRSCERNYVQLRNEAGLAHFRHDFVESQKQHNIVEEKPNKTIAHHQHHPKGLERDTYNDLYRIADYM